jgi:2-polyprenyl-3-methyl-5-hydroxy-6-metoxy-1,4-benzoquinol methylase
MRPSELARAMRRAGLSARTFQGVRYDLLHDRWERCGELDVNYMVYGVKG